MNAVTQLERIIHELIVSEGPMPVDRYFELVLGHSQFGYYNSRQPFGVGGDFITAPEISQIFGELVGIWCLQIFEMMGRPQKIALVECGPGQGHLMKDILRSANLMPDFLRAAQVHLIESSPRLQGIQRQALTDSSVPLTWGDTLDDLPPCPSIIIGNEFFDAIPIRQYQLRHGRWHERYVGLDECGKLAFVLSPDPVPKALIPSWVKGSNDNDGILELSPRRQAIAQAMGRHIAEHSGAILQVDYGSVHSGLGDTLQAVRNHGYVSIFDQPGEVDVTSHVDFEALGHAMHQGGAQVWPVLTQSAFLRAMGIEVRAQKLSHYANDEERSALDRSVDRLLSEHQMGTLFKVIAATSSSLALPYPFGQT